MSHIPLDIEVRHDDCLLVLDPEGWSALAEALAVGVATVNRMLPDPPDVDGLGSDTMAQLSRHTGTVERGGGCEDHRRNPVSSADVSNAGVLAEAGVAVSPTSLVDNGLD
ncbi:MAG TPA: hypothetical protein VHF87_17850 [Methylomirabilota bacterium]|nr:hypothetical protein [Methylomirabilota bacterium]